ncbi:hypothetical protein ED312_10090 [Sinomicrobium pectinilyticum]|uniref:Secreted protein n=1 Tax=Sinomicrobium pectinilyticum TaxID=1084421 RepID=A0A3N0EIX8_SINP1|nr:DUF6520 family protein [Sinomicrobium pectinilyticum]RNL87742.1 hypothetical protein ED312_10090 [Sinomicrobium pectinilyticum]
MKKFKFILPVLAFVLALTAAFAIPEEVETYKVETSELAPVPAWFGVPGGPCEPCIDNNGLTEEDGCAIQQGDICHCKVNGNSVQALSSPEEGCTILRRPSS